MFTKIIKNKNVLIIAALVAVAAVVLLIGITNQKPPVAAQTIAQTPVLNPSEIQNGVIRPNTPDQGAAGSLLKMLIPSAAAEGAEAEGEPDLSAMSADELKAYLESQYTADGYVLLYLANWNATYLLALPAEGEEDIETPIAQPAVSGEDKEYENILHVSSKGVYMANSNCDGQDCIQEGEVTLENKSSRVLGNMIVCSPHQLLIELYTRDEIVQMIFTTYQQN